MAQYYQIVEREDLKNMYPQLNLDEGIQLVMGDEVQFGQQQVILSQEPTNDLQLQLGGDSNNQHLQQIVYQASPQTAPPPQQIPLQQQQPQPQQNILESNYLVQQDDGTMTDAFVGGTAQQMPPQLTPQAPMAQLPQTQQPQIYYTDDTNGQMVHTGNVAQNHELMHDNSQPSTLHTMQTAAEQQLQNQQQIANVFQQQQQQQQQTMHGQQQPAQPGTAGNAILNQSGMRHLLLVTKSPQSQIGVSQPQQQPPSQKTQAIQVQSSMAPQSSLLVQQQPPQQTQAQQQPVKITTVVRAPCVKVMAPSVRASAPGVAPAQQPQPQQQQPTLQITGRGNYVFTNPRQKFLTINRPPATPRLAIFRTGTVSGPLGQQPLVVTQASAAAAKSLVASTAPGGDTELVDLEDSIQAVFLQKRSSDATKSPSVASTPASSGVAPGLIYQSQQPAQQQQMNQQVAIPVQSQLPVALADGTAPEGSTSFIPLPDGRLVTPAAYRTFQEKQHLRQQEARIGGFNQQLRVRMPQRTMVAIRSRAPLGRQTVAMHVPQQPPTSVQQNVTLSSTPIQQPIQIPSNQLLQTMNVGQSGLQQMQQLQTVSLQPSGLAPSVLQVVQEPIQVVQERESARMLVILQSGEQRLITFTLPKESCTVQELLEQVGVQYSPDSNIKCIANLGGEIDYIVCVGLDTEETNEVIKQAENTIKNHQLHNLQQQLQMQEQHSLQQQLLHQQQQLLPTAGIMQQGHLPQQVTVTLQHQLQPQQPPQLPVLSAQQSAPLRFNDSFCQTITTGGVTLSTGDSKGALIDGGTPEAKREPPVKLVKGFLAVCASCGYTGADHAKCQRCRRIFTEAPRRIAEPEKGSPASLNPPPLIPTVTSTPIVPRKYDIYGKKQSMSIILAMRGRGGSRSGRGRSRNAAMVSKYADAEPVVFTLSSDDEDSTSADRSKTIYKSINNISKLNASQSSEKREPLPCEPIIGDDKPRLDVTDVKTLPDGQITQLDCSTIRIGSLKYEANEKVTLSSKGMRIVAPNVKRPTEFVSLDLQMHEIVKVVVHFSKALNTMFVYTLPSCGQYVRQHLEMDLSEEKLPYFSPISRTNETHKRITLVMERITEESKSILKNIFIGQQLEEISVRDANELLLRCSPVRSASPASGDGNGSHANGIDSAGMLDATEIRKILIYPPGKGGISINTEDYMCLAIDQYLNDVIIDFYLNYLRLELLSEKARSAVHIFSSFFYNRLTTVSSRQRGHNRDQKQTAAQKRHTRVASWTKRENIFDRDFIVIPINEQSHWFLAIICFPGLEGPISMTSNVPTPVRKAKSGVKSTPKATKPPGNVSLQIGSTTITPVSKRDLESINLGEDDDCDERDEAEGDESELASETEETEDEEPTDARTAVKQPCILIFDSLTGASRSRVVATLRDYLTCEYRVKMPGKPPKLFNKLNMPGHCVKVPQQNNYTDCGLYLLQYVEHFFLHPIKDYNLPIKQLQNWFDTLTVTKKREDLSNLLKELIGKHNPKELPLPKIEFPTQDGRLIVEPEDGLNDPEFEEEEMEDEEFHTDLNNATDADEQQQPLADTEADGDTENSNPPNNVTLASSGTSLIKMLVPKRTYPITRPVRHTFLSRSVGGVSATGEGDEPLTSLVSLKRPMEVAAAVAKQQSTSESISNRSKQPRLTDSSGRIVS
ncbi:uncharacterized protein LOC131215783 [Anopheles bellator]|uniref:uncharacterized protein LOC131215783 n=1 Tax=Anopheles bellator TaxID=139047 RepID=UPI002649A546|nr:uncharacterized protein LOC131215783 [Anopheles bellator]